MNKALFTNKRVLVAVSTGIDSMVLLHKLLKINCEVFVVHINHQQREQSIEEEAYIREFCANKNINLTVKHFDYKKGNFQDEARKFRYSCFQEVYEKYEINYLVTAHHKNDLVETLLIRLVRGANVLTASGFKECDEMMNMKIIRPLINTAKSEIINYAEKYGVEYFNDESNDNNKYLRNFIRNEFINKLGIDNVNNLKKFVDEINDINIFLEKEAKKLITHYSDVFISCDADILIIKYAIKYVFKHYFKSDVKKINKDKIEMICDMLENDRGKIQVTSDLNVYFSNNQLIFSKDEASEYEFELSCDKIKIDFLNSTLLLNEGDKTLSISSEVELPLVIKNANLDDEIQLKIGKQKLNRVFINAKIPKRKRTSWPTLIDSENKVVSVLGIKNSIYCDKSVKNVKFMLQYECIFKGDDENA